MSDIDFDELDKAVNSLMGGAPKSPKDEQKPKEKVLEIGETLKPNEKPSFDKLNEVARSIKDESIEPDVKPTVHTISTTQPIGSSSTETLLAVPARGASPVSPQPASGRFMDVVHPSSDMRTANSTPPPATPPVEKPSIPTPAPQVTPDTPLTPFLPDAKVEKRPLGGGAVPSPFNDEKPANAKPPVKTPQQDEVKVEETVSINSEKPVEATDHKQATLNPAAYEAPSPAESPELSAIESAEVVPEPENQTIASVESGDTEKLTTKEGTIYDVANQPQPLGHPAKQKSGWGTVIVIIIIIALAAALGAAAYFILGLGV